MSSEDIRNALTLWTHKKIQVQEIPHDETLFDVNEDLDFNLRKYWTGNISRLVETVKFDSTSRFLECDFYLSHEGSETDYENNDYCNASQSSTIYDVLNLKKTNIKNLDFTDSNKHITHVCDYYDPRRVNRFMLCGIFIGEVPKSSIFAPNFFWIKKKGSSILMLEDHKLFSQYKIMLLSDKVAHMALNQDFTMIAAVLVDGRILLLFPIKIDNFRTFNNNYDIDFVYA